MTRTIDTARRRPRLTRAARLAAAAAAAVLLAACAGEGGTRGGGASAQDDASDGGSVAWGASAEEFAAALGDMEPVELKFALSFSSESTLATPYHRFADYLEENSGGKLNVEFYWSNSGAGLADMDTKIKGGVVDTGTFGPYYVPDAHPVSGVVAGAVLAPLMGGGPVGDYLVSQAASMAWAAETPEYLDELEGDGGLFVLSGSQLTYPQTMLCSGEPGSTLAQLANRPTGATTAAQVAELEGLGAQPVSAQISEIYQMVDRGIMECMAGSFGLHVVTGQIELADYWTIDTETSFSSVPNPWVISRSLWDSLPLAARQVIFDGSVWLKAWQVEAAWEDFAVVTQQALDSGIEFTEFGDDVRESLAQTQAEQVARVAAGELDRGAFEDPSTAISVAEDVHERWIGLVEDLGYDMDTGWGDEFIAWYEAGAPDLEPWVEALHEEIFAQRRPA